MAKNFVKVTHCEAVKWDGRNFSEVADFVRKHGGNVAWLSKQLYWTEKNVPNDLRVYVCSPSGDFVLYKGFYIIVKNDSDKFETCIAENFESEFIEVEA